MLKAELIQKYHSINKGLTLIVIALLILFSLVMWLAKVDLEGRSSLVVGLLLMIGAIAVFQLPRISFGIWKHRYQRELAEYPLLITTWSNFKDELRKG